MSFFIPEILESFLGSPRKHNEANGQIAFDCPVCSEEKRMPEGDGKGNLEVNYKEGVYRCWVCSGTHGTHGTIGKLIHQHGTKNAMSEYNLVKPDYEYLRLMRDDEELNKVIVTLPQGYKRLADCTKFEWKYGEAMKYLKGRGITNDIIDRYDIGFTTEGERKDRIIIPSYDKEGSLNYYIARAWSKWTRPKYLNPDSDKMGVLFNGRFIDLNSTIYIVEGGFDHIVVPNSIPLLGKYLSPEMIFFLRKCRANIVILLDDDAIDDAKVIYRQLNAGPLFGRVRLGLLPEGKDPSKIYEIYGAKGVQSLIRSTIIPSESRI